MIIELQEYQIRMSETFHSHDLVMGLAWIVQPI